MSSVDSTRQTHEAEKLRLNGEAEALKDKVAMLTEQVSRERDNAQEMRRRLLSTKRKMDALRRQMEHELHRRVAPLREALRSLKASVNADVSSVMSEARKSLGDVKYKFRDAVESAKVRELSPPARRLSHREPVTLPPPPVPSALTYASLSFRPFAARRLTTF